MAAWRVVHLNLISAVDRARKAGLGPQERANLVRAIDAVMDSGLLVSHPHAETMRTLIRAARDVIQVSIKGLPGGPAMDRMAEAYVAHLKAVAHSGRAEPVSLPQIPGRPARMTSWREPTGDVREVTDFRDGIPNLGRD